MCLSVCLPLPPPTSSLSKVSEHPWVRNLKNCDGKHRQTGLFKTLMHRRADLILQDHI